MEPGLSALLTHHVVESDLATHWQNAIPVLATPVLLWLSEIACMKVIEEHMDEDQMSVGVGHNSEHLAPTPIHFTVTVQATLKDIQGNRLVFGVEGHDSRDLIFKGIHVRQIVDKKRFMAKVNHKVSNG